MLSLMISTAAANAVLAVIRDRSAEM